MSIKLTIKKFLIDRTKPCIIFESLPDFGDNTRPVYDELIKRGYDKKYNLFWYIDNNTFAVLKNGEPYYWKLWDFSKIRDRFYNWSFQKEKKALIICNRFLVPYPIKECNKSFFLTHGSPIKDVRNYYTLPNEIDYCLISSQRIIDITSYNYNYDTDRIIPLGYPRNDILSEPCNFDIKTILNTDSNTIILWCPTFKQQKSGLKTGCKNAIPIIYDKSKAERLNLYLNQKNILLVIKPHFVQDLSFICSLELSNIMIIMDDFFRKNRITFYQFMKSCDALITDYSSIYYDFTLCNKPIGLIWEDIDDYKINPGLLPNYEYYMQGGVKIYNLDDLLSFISDVKKGKDFLKNERNEIRDYFNISTDGKNTKRVVDFIIQEANL